MKNLELRALEAIGRPAIFEIPSQHGRAVGDVMIFEPASNRIYLKSSQGIVVEHEDQRFESQELQYSFLPDGRLGNTLARGPGRFLRNATRERDALEIRWQEELRIRPDQNLKAISLYGQPQVRVGNESTFRASRVHLWLDEIPEDPKTQASRPNQDADSKSKVRLVPVKMLAEGNVESASGEQVAERSNATQRMIHFDSERIQAATDHLEVFFTAPLSPSSTDDREGEISADGSETSPGRTKRSLTDSLSSGNSPRDPQETPQPKVALLGRSYTHPACPEWRRIFRR